MTHLVHTLKALVLQASFLFLAVATFPSPDDAKSSQEFLPSEVFVISQPIQISRSPKSKSTPTLSSSASISSSKSISSPTLSSSASISSPTLSSSASISSPALVAVSITTSTTQASSTTTQASSPKTQASSKTTTATTTTTTEATISEKNLDPVVQAASVSSQPRDRRQLNFIQKMMLAYLHPQPIVDTIREEEKYGNTGESSERVGRAIVSGTQAVSRLLNSAIDFPFDMFRNAVGYATDALNTVGTRLVGL